MTFETDFLNLTRGQQSIICSFLTTLFFFNNTICIICKQKSILILLYGFCLQPEQSNMHSDWITVEHYCFVIPMGHLHCIGLQSQSEKPYDKQLINLEFPVFAEKSQTSILAALSLRQYSRVLV